MWSNELAILVNLKEFFCNYVCALISEMTSVIIHVQELLKIRKTILYMGVFIELSYFQLDVEMRKSKNNSCT